MAKSTKSAVKIQTELSRDLGLTTALSIGIGTMIAAGIFTLSGLAVRDVGSAAIVAFLLAALVALFTALTYCEFASIYPESGEGYLYTRKTFSAPVAYFVGWALFLGYTSSCAFYIASFSSYFYEFIWKSDMEMLAGLLALAALTLLNIKGTKESGKFQVVITLGKVLLLLWFVLGGLSSVNTAEIIERFNSDFFKIGSTAAMVFITFFGFSAIAATAGEVKNPIKTIPRAIFISMGLVTLLYSLVVLTIVGAELTEYTEASMGKAAQQFLGPVGGIIIVAGALFSMISASNASIMAGSRVTMAMSRLGHFPEEFGAVNPQTRTPVVSLLLVGGTIMIFSISLPLEGLAHFADTVLLLVLILVNGALIYHRKKYPKIKRPFKAPLVPLLPAMGIMANLYLLTQILHHLTPVFLAVACLLLGVLAFFAWKGAQAEESALPGQPSRVALGKFAIREGQFRILIPLANPATVSPLIELGAAIASERNGEIVTLRVALVPEQLPPSDEDFYVERETQILESAHAQVQKHGLPVTSLVRVGHNAARAILETARERDCNLILMGWKGYSSTRKKILGEVTDAIVTNARSDIILVKLRGDGPMQKFLLPTAGGEHTRCAEDYLASIIRFRKGVMTVCSVASPDAKKDKVRDVKEMLDQAVTRLTTENEVVVESKLIRHTSVSKGIINEAQNHDVVVVGAAGYGIYSQIILGSIPENIAKRSNRPVILVKHYSPVKALFSRVMRE